MAQVLIRGRISTVELAAGEETVVEDTARVQELARFGYIRIVGSIACTHHEPPDVVLSAAERAVAAGEDPVVDIESGYPDDADGEPPRSGHGSGKSMWQRFLTAHGINYPEGTTRDDLIAVWDSRDR